MAWLIYFSMNLVFLKTLGSLLDFHLIKTTSNDQSDKPGNVSRIARPNRETADSLRDDNYTITS